MRSSLSLATLLVLVLLVSACSGDDGDSTTTTVAAEGTTTTTAAPGGDGGGTDDGTTDDTSAAAAATTTTAALSGEPVVPEFTIASRAEGEDGDTVVVLLDPDSYESLTDIDLQNVLSQVVDDFPPIYEAHVVDSEEVTELVLAEEVTPDEQRLLDIHYLVKLEEGFRITYVGVFEESGTAILGS
jgi:hypothetical protein